MRKLPIPYNDIRLVGIHGPLNGGKNTAATFYQSKFPFRTYAFADPLKTACRIMLGFTEDQIEDRVLKEAVDPFWGITPRYAMQRLGTEWGRGMIAEDIWIKRAQLELNDAFANGQSVILTDVRFQNEADWLRAQPNSILIHLEVPGLEKGANTQHASEAGIDYKPEVDVKIVNDKSAGLEAFYNQLDKVFTI